MFSLLAISGSRRNEVEDLGAAVILANGMGLRVPVIGSGAVLAQLKRQGLIDSVQAVLDAWKRHGYFVSQVFKATFCCAPARGKQPQKMQ